MTPSTDRCCSLLIQGIAAGEMSLLSLNCEDTKINSDDLETLSFRLSEAAHSATFATLWVSDVN